MKTLAVKYRPTTFNDVVEQSVIVQILQEQIKTNTFKNCYLFTGSQGVGKTTLARILANEINKGKGIPIEIDGASNNGVEQVREIGEMAKLKSIDSDYKVFIIDECHSITSNGWQAMLKLIEEPPQGTIFIFCTTDPQKIPQTILSRVQRYDLQRISTKAIVDRLVMVLTMENEEIFSNGGADQFYTFEENSLLYIAKVAEGGMRDALTLLDKCISFSDNLTVENVTKTIGVVDYPHMITLLWNIIDKQHKSIIIGFENLYNDGIDLKKFMKSFQLFIVDVLKYFYVRNLEYIYIPSVYEDDLKDLIEESELLLDILDKVIELNDKLKFESNPRAMIEASLILF